MRLLLVEDDDDLAAAIAAAFRRRGAAVDHAAALGPARDFLAVQGYDAVILDMNLPDGFGAELLREARSRGDRTPVLVLTARFGVDDRIEALDEGADDYLVKPFDLRELEARIRAIARRSSRDAGGAISFGGLEFDPAAQTAAIDGEPLTLARREFALLEILVAHRGRVIAKERIFERMFSFEEEEVGINAVETYVARLRRKMDGRGGIQIRTLRGLGYQLDKTHEA